LPDGEFKSRKFAGESVRGANMVKVGVRKHDAADWRAHLSRGLAYAMR